MARNFKMPDADEGYPQSNRSDGIDLSIPVGGYQNDALVITTQVERHTNSKTGLPCDPPEYYSNDRGRAGRQRGY